MGCLTGLAVLLALAIPVAICRASLAGALVLIAIFALLAAGLALQRKRPRAYPRIAAATLVYAAVVVGVHFI